MSRGNALDSAAIECFFPSLKTEFVHRLHSPWATELPPRRSVSSREPYHDFGRFVILASNVGHAAFYVRTDN